MKTDQAQELRELSISKEDIFSLAITSGKGGVGKTTLVINLAYGLTQLGFRVLILDADLGLANIDVMLNLAPKLTLNHVLYGDKNIEDIILEGANGFHIIPASSGIQKMVTLEEHQKQKLLEQIRNLYKNYDIMLIDTGAGIYPSIISMTLSAQEIIVVTTPEPPAFKDAYSVLRLLSLQYHRPKLWLVVNQVAKIQEGQLIFDKMHWVVNKFLDLELALLGIIPSDNKVSKAIEAQEVLLQKSPKSQASEAIKNLAQQICFKFLNDSEQSKSLVKS